jgi:hypothetical protein
MAMMTLAFSLRKIWSHPQLLEQAGVAHPRRFLVQYAISYVAAKLGILLLMASGDAPEWFGCEGCDALPPDPALSGVPREQWYQRQPKVGTKEYCIWQRNSCKDHFFSDRVLVQFLPALMWVPLCVYCNNEVAQLIDGLWWKHARNDDTGRIGLSDALHGYRAVSPLVQVFVVLCAALSFGSLFDSNSTKAVSGHWPVGLKIFMYGSVLGLNGLMVLRLLIGLDCRRCCCCCCCRRRQPKPESSAVELLEMLTGRGSERGLTLRV